MVLPPFHQRGYGNFLVSLSYELSVREGKTGTPEQPFSDMGEAVYYNYWAFTILSLLVEYGSTSLSIRSISETTGIEAEDVYESMLDMRIVRKVGEDFYIVKTEDETNVESAKEEVNY